MNYIATYTFCQSRANEQEQTKKIKRRPKDLFLYNKTFPTSMLEYSHDEDRGFYDEKSFLCIP